MAIKRSDAKKQPFLLVRDSQGNIKKLLVPHDLRPESLTQLFDGSPLFVAGSNVTIVSQSNGQLEFSAAGGSSVDDSIVATLTGSNFSGPIIATGGLTGSLQRLPTGETYLAADTGITVTTQSNGQILIGSTAAATQQAYYGYSTGSVNFNATTWTDFTAVPGNWTDSISDGITRSGAAFSVSRDGYYRVSVAFNFGKSTGGYLGLRLSGSNGTIAQHTFFAASNVFPTTGWSPIVNLLSGSSFNLQYATKTGTPASWNVTDPLDGENMRTCEVAINYV